MKWEIYKSSFQGWLLLCVELERPRGWNIIEKCYPGIFIEEHGLTFHSEIVPESHPFFGDANEVTTNFAFELLPGGKTEAEEIVKKLVADLDAYLAQE